MRVKLGKVDGKLIATPLDRGAGIMMSLVKADGLVIVSQKTEGIEAGEEIDVQLLRGLSDIEGTLVSIGSHDVMLDIIGNLIHMKYPKTNFSSTHTGSMGGLIALKRGECHLAPIHILEPKNGKYNVDAILTYFKKEELVIVKGVGREQGLMIEKGNPKGIESIKDIAREGILFVNRQKGSGTRLLTDHILREEGIDKKLINGYQREMTTHTSVASAVQTGSAHVGVGVLSVAQAFKVDFIPVGFEEYDFALPKKYLQKKEIKEFIEILRSDELKRELDQLGGYRYDCIGEIIEIEEANKQ